MRNPLAPIAACSLLCAASAHAQTPLDGTLDAGFGVAGIATITGVPAESVTLGFAGTLVEDASGTVVVGRGDRMGTPVFAAVRLTPTGTLDTTYGQNGVATIPVPFSGVVPSNVVTLDAVRRADGRVVVGVYTQRDANTVGLFVFALDASGNLVTSYGPGGAPGFIDFGSFDDTDFVALQTSSVELGPDGAVYVAARIRDSAPSTGVGRLDPNGSLDPTFGALGVAMVDAGSYGLTIQDDGKLLLPAGDLVEPGNTRAGVLRLLPTGLPDPGFGTGGFAGVDFQPGFDYANAIAVDGERIFLGASYTGDTGPCGLCIARLTSSGALETSFNAAGNPPGIARTRSALADQGVELHVGVAGGIGYTATILDDAIGDTGDVGAFVAKPSGRSSAAFAEGVFRFDSGGGARDFLHFSLVDTRHRLLLASYRADAQGYAVAAVQLDTVFTDDNED